MYLDRRFKEEGIENTRIVDLYALSGDKLIMEFVDGVTWSELKQTNENDKLMESFSEGGGMFLLSIETSRGKAETKLDNIIVNKKNEEYEFVIIDQ
jgi:hypothetical protein